MRERKTFFGIIQKLDFARKYSAVVCVFLYKKVDIVYGGNKVRRNNFLPLSQLKAHKVNGSQRKRERESARHQNEIILFVFAKAQTIFSVHACIQIQQLWLIVNFDAQMWKLKKKNSSWMELSRNMYVRVCATKIKWGNVQHTFIVICTYSEKREREKRSDCWSMVVVKGWIFPLRSALNFFSLALIRNNFLMICILWLWLRRYDDEMFERKLTYFYFFSLYRVHFFPS